MVILSAGVDLIYLWKFKNSEEIDSTWTCIERVQRTRSVVTELLVGSSKDTVLSEDFEELFGNATSPLNRKY